MFRDEVREHLENKIIPFWQNLKDDAFGGFTRIWKGFTTDDASVGAEDVAYVDGLAQSKQWKR